MPRQNPDTPDKRQLSQSWDAPRSYSHWAELMCVPLDEQNESNYFKHEKKAWPSLNQVYP